MLMIKLSHANEFNHDSVSFHKLVLDVQNKVFHIQNEVKKIQNTLATSRCSHPQGR